MKKRTSTILKGILIFFTILFTSCSYHTDISYRVKKNQEFIKEDGYMIDCILNGQTLLVEVFTPQSAGKGYYYDELQGEKSNREVKISHVQLIFENPRKTIFPKKKIGKEDYSYRTKNLSELLDDNESIQLLFQVKDCQTGTVELKKYTLHRVKHTYSTGTFPHA